MFFYPVYIQAPIPQGVQPVQQTRAGEVSAVWWRDVSLQYARHQKNVWWREMWKWLLGRRRGV